MTNKKIKIIGAVTFTVCFILAVFLVAVRDLVALRRKASYRIATIDKIPRSRNFDLTFVNVDTDEALDLIEFVGPEVGFVGNHEGTFFKTVDGGITWKRAEFLFPVTGRVNAIHFSSESVGWVLLQQLKDDRKDFGINKAWLLYTNDGGKSWQTQVEEPLLELLRINFADVSEGWVLGSRPAKPFSKLVLLHSNDGGKKWNDLSTGANDFIRASRTTVFQSPPDSAVDLVATGPGAVTILMQSESILSTEDGGGVWQLLSRGSVGDGTFVSRIESGFDGSFRTLIRHGGVEGTVSAFAMSAKDSSFVQNVLPGVYVEETAQLSKSEILACGYAPVRSDSLERRVRKEGLLLYSADEGRNWSAVYRSIEIPRINAISTRTGTGEFWAVGSKGRVIRLLPSS